MSSAVDAEDTNTKTGDTGYRGRIAKSEQTRDEPLEPLADHITDVSAMGGIKAHYWTKNKQWVSENVKKPSDYVQINHEQLKIDCMEWGLSTIEIENLRRLTPEVVQTEGEAWHIDYDFQYPANEANEANFNYCLDVAINFLIKKQEFDSSRKWPKREKSFPAPPVYIGKFIYEKPTQTASVIHIVQERYYYSVERIVAERK